MRTGETGLNLIKGYEGLRMSAHYAPTEQWTVGYGHTGSARHGMSVTDGDAATLVDNSEHKLVRATSLGRACVHGVHYTAAWSKEAMSAEITKLACSMWA